MAEIQKGIVSSIEGKKARVKPYTGGTSVTHLLEFKKKITVRLDREDGEKKEIYFYPELKVGDIVTYVSFEDSTGHLIGRMGGD